MNPTFTPSASAISAKRFSSTVLPTPRRPTSMQLLPDLPVNVRPQGHAEPVDQLVATDQGRRTRACARLIRISEAVHELTNLTMSYLRTD